MTTTASPTLSLTPRAHLIWVCICLSWLAWLLAGSLPVTPLEGDEVGVIHGATALASGDMHYWDLRYLYEIQPGSYVLISQLARLTHASPEMAFAWLTVGGAVLFATIAGCLVQRLLCTPWPLVAVAFLLSQEVWAGAYYLNTTAMGGWVALLALLVALPPVTRLRAVIVAALLAVAGWIRIDCLMISPVVVALSWRRHRAWLPVAHEVIPIAALSLALLVGLYAASHVHFREVLAAYEERGGYEGWAHTAAMYCVVTSALVGVLSIVGVLLMARRRDWALLFVWIGGVTLSFAVYGRSLASNKYLYLATPFFILAAVFVGRDILARWSTWSRRCRYAVGGLLGCLLLFDTVLGILTSSPAYRLYEPGPTLGTLARVSIGGRDLELTLGGGELIATTDGYRIRGGTLFAPLAWTRDKADLIRSRRQFSSTALQQRGDSSVFVGDWLGYQLALRELRLAGFDFNLPHFPNKAYSYAGIWQKAGKRVHLGYLAYGGSVYFDPHRIPSSLTGAETYFLGALGDHGPLVELNDGMHWQLRTAAYGFIKLHQRESH